MPSDLEVHCGDHAGLSEGAGEEELEDKMEVTHPRKPVTSVCQALELHRVRFPRTKLAVLSTPRHRLTIPTVTW